MSDYQPSAPGGYRGRSRSPPRSPPRGGRSRSPPRRSRSPPRRRYSRSPPRRRYSRSPPRRRPPPPRPSARELENSTSLFIGNLSYSIQEQDLAEMMEKCGRVRAITVGFNRRTGQPRGYAFVEFENRRDAEEAYDRYKDYNLDGRRIRVDWDVGLDKKGSGGGGGRGGGGRRSRSPPRRRSRSPPRRYSPRRSPPRGRSRTPPPRNESRSPPRDRKRSRSPSPADDSNKKPKVNEP